MNNRTFPNLQNSSSMGLLFLRVLPLRKSYLSQYLGGSLSLSLYFLALSALISRLLFHLKLIFHRVREESATQFLWRHLLKRFCLPAFSLNQVGYFRVLYSMTFAYMCFYANAMFSFKLWLRNKYLKTRNCDASSITILLKSVLVIRRLFCFIWILGYLPRFTKKDSRVLMGMSLKL